MRPLRACIDVLVVGSAAIALMTALRLYETHLEEQNAVDSTRAALMTIRSEVGIRSALGGKDLNEFGHPMNVDTTWFDHVPTRNVLASEHAPWIELAMPNELARNHPTDPTLRGGRGAMFWYNPVRGIVRARVPDQTTDEATLSLYEAVNGDEFQP